MKEEQNKKSYKSPKGKLFKFFEKSRDQWKSKYKEVKKKVKQLKNRVSFLEKSKENLKIRVKELESELAQMKEKEQKSLKEEEFKKRLLSKSPTRKCPGIRDEISISSL